MYVEISIIFLVVQRFSRRLLVRVSNANFFHFESQNARSQHVSDACHGLSLVTPRSYVSGPVPRLERHYRGDWCQKTSELTSSSLSLSLSLILSHERLGNAARNVAIIRVRNWRRYDRMKKKRKKRTLKWNELLKYTSAYKSLNNYRCGQSRGVSFAIIIPTDSLLFFFFFFFSLTIHLATLYFPND